MVLNASLELGLRGRRPILYEVADHLREAATAEGKNGASPQEAQRRAISAFGSPQEVAAGFESDLAGQIDKRLAVIGRRLDVWMAQHPWGGAASRMALVLPFAAAIVALGTLFGVGVDAALGPAGFVFTMGSWWSLHLGFKAWRLRARPERGLRARLRAHDPQLLGLEEGWLLGGMAMVGAAVGALGLYIGDFVGFPFFTGLCVIVFSLSPLIEWLASRGY